ncbi:MAG: hypothetical protein P4L16_03730 [Chlamydiales bacterium]|nr:hypothetical protein [Chlamydiales bacterium]
MSDVTPSSPDNTPQPVYTPPSATSPNSSKVTYKVPTKAPPNLSPQEQTTFKALMKMALEAGQSDANNTDVKNKAEVLKHAMEEVINHAVHEGHIAEGPVTQEVANAAYLELNNLPA